MAKRRKWYSGLKKLWNSPKVATLRVKAFELLGSALAFYYMSSWLSHLSGTALWVPQEWRDLVRLVSTALGSVVFFYVRHRAEAKSRGSHRSSGAEVTIGASGEVA